MGTGILEEQTHSVAVSDDCSQKSRPTWQVLPPQDLPAGIGSAFRLLQEPLVAPPVRIHIGSLPDDRLRLIRPLLVEVTKDEAGFIAECESLNEFGYGDNLFDAIDDLRETVCELFWELNSDEEKLAPGLAELSRLIKEMMEAG